MAFADLGVVERSGNDFIDSILGDSVWANSNGGSPVNLTYSFQVGATTLEDVTYQGKSWEPFEEAAFVRALTNFEAVANLTFTQGSGQTDLRFYLVDETEEFLGYQDGPEGLEEDGRGLFSYTSEGWNEEGLQTGEAYYTILHELGHGVGLGHPHDDGFGSGIFPGIATETDQDGDVFGEPDDLGLDDLNQGVFTVMSYNFNYTGTPSPSDDYGLPASLGAFDIYALQLMYGANLDHATGDDVYQLVDQSGSGSSWQTLWDAGGNDVISAQGSDVDALIDLRAAPLVGEQAGGYLSQAEEVTGGFVIAHGVVIEEALGGQGSDTLRGNEANNNLGGGAGQDDLFGAAGGDFLQGNQGQDFLQGNQGDDTIRGGSGDDTLRGGQGNDTLYGDKGDDVLFGDFGGEVFYGGDGADRFVIRGGDGQDRIEDFDAASGDRLELRSGFSSSEDSDGVIVALDDGGEVFLVGASGFSDDWVV
ncbi:M10 family metallopeptidase C-terminal domain-containing protein [Rhodovibrionaceae bacterium A322]